MEAALVRQGFRLAEIRAMGVDEAETFLALLYPSPRRTTGAKSLRQNWKRWKKRP